MMRTIRVSENAYRLFSLVAGGYGETMAEIVDMIAGIGLEGIYLGCCNAHEPVGIGGLEAMANCSECKIGLLRAIAKGLEG